MLVRAVHSSEIDEAARLVAESFASKEPLASHLHLAVDRFSLWVAEVIHSSAQEGLTFVAVDGEEIQGVLIGETMSVDQHVPEYPEAQPVFDLLDSLYSERPHLGVKVMHIFMVATAASSCNKGVARTLTTHAIETGRERGYTDVYAELTAPATQHIYLRRLGFAPLKEVVFDEYAGPFKGCEGKVVLGHLALSE